MKRPDLFKYPEVFVASMEELIRRYQAALKLGISKLDYEVAQNLDCLLCHPLNHEFNHDNVASKNGVRAPFIEECQLLGCPWMVILGMACNYYSYHIYESSNPIVINRRIKQIRNWIKIYKKHMDKNNSRIILND